MTMSVLPSTENIGTEPELDPTDPYARAAQTFPRLSEEAAERVAQYGVEQGLRKGTTLFQRGQRGVDFFLVLEGSIEILGLDEHARPKVVTVHGERQFTGELDLFNDQRILVTARTGMNSLLVRVKRSDFRKMLSAEPDIGEVMMRAFILRRVGLIRHAQGALTLIGRARCADTLRLNTFLTRNAYPHRMLDAESDSDAAALLTRFDVRDDKWPVIVTGDQVLSNPRNSELADLLGLTEQFDADRVFDVAVIGAGPAGLAAAVYAASEGLSTVVVEALAPGGQAGTSSKIENYLGFPTGISGQALAGRAQVQAQKFGAHMAISRAAVGIDCNDQPYRLQLEDERSLAARAVVIATGARYRKLDVPDYQRFEGQGIHYAATAMEQQLSEGEEVVIVGGGNSAGQAAVFLSRTVAHAHILVRGAGLAATMSDYLVQRIDASSKITLHAFTEITALAGDAILREVTWTNRRTGISETRRVGNVFVMIGAEPNTAWLDGCLALDSGGFIVTGHDADGGAARSVFATTAPGIFAVGDVRSGSIKRVAAGVGEGAAVVQAIHGYLHPTIG